MAYTTSNKVRAIKPVALSELENVQGAYWGHPGQRGGGNILSADWPRHPRMICLEFVLDDRYIKRNWTFLTALLWLKPEESSWRPDAVS